MMKRPVLVASLAGGLALAAVTAVVGQSILTDPVPTFTIESPSSGAVVGNSAVVFGTAADDDGVARVQYRIQGQRKWRNAQITEAQPTPDDGEGNPQPSQTNVDFSFQAKMRKGSNTTRIQLKVIDKIGNESDYVTRKFRRKSRV